MCSKSTKTTTLLYGVLKRLRILVKSAKFQGKSPAQVVIHVQVVIAQMGRLLF